MLVFVDESGDTGFKLGQGSSGQFTVTLVVFADNAEAEAASRRIDRLRVEMDLPQDSRAGEFHFNDNSNEQREAFLKAVSSFDFSVFYNLVCGLVFDTAKASLVEASIVIDSTGGKEFKQQLEKYLRQRMNEPNGRRRIKQIRMKPSHTDNLLQLADMVCGAIVRACYQDLRTTARFRRIIQHREASVLVWPQ